MSDESDFDSLAPWLRLNQCQGIGPLRAARLLQAFGSPAAVFAQSADALRSVLRNRAQVQAVLDSGAEAAPYLEKVRRWLQASGPLPGVGRAIWTPDHPHYPPSLRSLDDPPLVLYVVGPTHILKAQTPWWQRNTAHLAIVGSRNPTPQGRQNAHQFAAWLQAAGVCIVSGLARGIDGAAHEGALQGLDGDAAQNASVATIAVMGTGADRVYPSAHRELAQRIATGGLLLTEQPLGAPPLATHFPKRNRIITGLSQATLVVEATLQSGSLLSARLALEQGRDVMAIPGSIHSPQSQGCHHLIKQGAKLVDQVTDILEELNLRPALPESTQPTASLDAGESENESEGEEEDESDLSQSPPAIARTVEAQPEIEPETGPQSPLPSQASPKKAAEPSPASAPRPHSLLDAMGYEPVSLEELSARTGLGTAELQVQLLELELAQSIARMPGGLFQRIGMA